jgi:uncharacterized metal-binding protein YceD (DUF177 family)
MGHVLCPNKETKNEKQLFEMKQKKFTYKVNVSHVSDNPVRVNLEADEQERAALANEWGVLSVEAVSADLEIKRWKRDGVRIKGPVEAQITQRCVVTLEPVASAIDERIDALFVPDGSRLARVETGDDGEMIVSADGPDAPETFQGDSIDVAQVCEEFIVLAMDPYPRIDGAVLDIEPDTPSDEVENPSPFAGLEGWKYEQ